MNEWEKCVRDKAIACDTSKEQLTRQERIHFKFHSSPGIPGVAPRSNEFSFRGDVLTEWPRAKSCLGTMRPASVRARIPEFLLFAQIIHDKQNWKQIE
ncbi:hypothetical protein EVAR_33451_1 [Eumeta japonica]|uniref:Uncharacterized protein n=1 Tax=Eumeta variegata TaxID=151549 RepID=A0A4C1WHU5_EUMVA|nr:hypothetical protein EVAR_33451_1 [Eumeta japonica]